MLCYDIFDKIPLRKKGNSSPQRAQRMRRNKENGENYCIFSPLFSLRHSVLSGFSAVG